jgi:hypothetical protein
MAFCRSGGHAGVDIRVMQVEAEGLKLTSEFDKLEA